MLFTDWMENELIDKFRGTAMTLPATLWLGLLSEISSDSVPVEVVFGDYARQPMPRDLDTWAETQGTRSGLVSTGTSHASSNNDAIDFGTAGSGTGDTAVYWALFDAETDGNCICAVPLAAPIPITSGDPVAFATGDLTFTLAPVGMSNYLANKLIDEIWRGETFVWPANTYAAYTTTMPTNSTPGTEPAAGYARVAIASSFSAWLGTSGTTGESAGTSGEMSNAAAITFPVPTAAQGDAEGSMLMDAASGGNMLVWGAIEYNGDPTPVSIPATGVAPRYEAGQFVVRVR